MNNLIIGIAGGSGSGKTTLALRLKERFGEDEVRLISHDSYYKRHDELPFTAWAASASFGKRRRAFKIIPCKTKGTHSRIAAGAFLYTGFSGRRCAPERA